jgi:AcrR family transcriptional regulator
MMSKAGLSCRAMSYIAERRLEEKERRRAEILDAAESVASVEGWDAMTMDQVARKARLSRALVYVYFKDKTDLMFGINVRGLAVLKQRFVEVVARNKRGIDQIEGFGRAYVALSQEFPVYFDVLARCELVTPEDKIDLTSNEGLCLTCGDEVLDLMVTSLETGIHDGSIRSDIGSPRVVGVALWGFMYGVVQVATTKANILGHRGVVMGKLMEQSLALAVRSLVPAS